MSLKLVIVCCLAIILIDAALGAPYPKTEDEFVKSFVKFLEQDKELSAGLHRASEGEHRVVARQKRQAEDDGMDDEQDVDLGPKEPGFFDRAAKFVMEVLQRFLKWINTDN